MTSRRIHIRIRDIDQERIDLIQQVHNISTASVLRMGLVALLKEAGFIKDFSDLQERK